MRRTLALVAIALLLAGCATYDGGYRERHVYRDGSYYYPYDDGRGDYYVGRSTVETRSYLSLGYGYGHYDPYWWGGYRGPFRPYVSPYPYRSSFSLHYGWSNYPWYLGYSHYGWPSHYYRPHHWPRHYTPPRGHAPRPPRDREDFRDDYRRHPRADAPVPERREWRERRGDDDHRDGWRERRWQDGRDGGWREHDGDRDRDRDRRRQWQPGADIRDSGGWRGSEPSQDRIRRDGAFPRRLLVPGGESAGGPRWQGGPAPGTEARGEFMRRGGERAAPTPAVATPPPSRPAARGGGVLRPVVPRGGAQESREEFPRELD